MIWARSWINDTCNPAMPDFASLQGERPRLAHCFAKHWQTPLQDYAKLLYGPRENRIENLFLFALREELEESGYDPQEIEDALAYLEETPVLQCSHHVTPTFGPTFLTLDLISLSGIPEGKPYLIAANSGVPFSNSAWSGALSYQDLPLEELVEVQSPLFKKAEAAKRERAEHGESELRLSLIPAKLRDQLVFGEKIPTPLLESFSHLQPELKRLLAKPEEGVAYSSFANQCARRIEEKLFSRKVIIFDFNRLIARYLVKLFEQEPDHPIILLLSDPEILEKMNKGSEHPLTFLASYSGKKSKKLEKLLWTGNALQGQKFGNQSVQFKEVIQGLKEQRLCPGILLSFLVTRFCQGIRCLGSFNQIDYLEKIRLDLDQLGLDWLDLSHFGPSLTTGRLSSQQETWMPLDMALKGEGIELTKFQKIPMGTFWEHYYYQFSS